MTDKVGRATGLIALWCLALSAQASFHTYQFNELYSNADGNIQFVELREAQGAFGQNFLVGVTLTATNGATQKSFTFERNLASSATAGTFVLIATQGFAALGLVTPDYIVPDGFFPLGSGTLNYDGVDTLTYSGLPADGSTSINRSGLTQTNSPRNFAGAAATVIGPQTGVVEFYNTTLNHFFVTADPVERASIDAGGSGPGWTRTGNTFKSGGPNAVCRFFGVQSAGGPNGHFYTADPDECAQVKLDPGWQFESLDFAITPAQAGGTCPAGLIPVYRAYNNRFAQRDSNHRLTANFAAYQQQIAAGWTGEGIVMCAQP